MNESKEILADGKNFLGAELLRFNTTKKWVVLDTETEDLNLLTTRPWEVAIVIGQGNKIISSECLYPFWDDLRVSEDAARITGFNAATYKQKSMCAKKAWHIVSEYLFDPEYLHLQHNGFNFDIFVLKTWAKLVGAEFNWSWLKRLYDTNCFAKAKKMEINIPQDPKELLDFQFRMAPLHRRGIKTNLGQLCKDYNIECDPAKQHQAEYDCELLYKVWRDMLYKLPF